MATHAGARRPAVRAEITARLHAPRWPAPAWAAITLTVLFIGTTLWWVGQDRSIPIYDAGFHLSYALETHSQLAAGHLLKALSDSLPYPPLTYLIGSLGIAIGGLGVAPPIIANNLLFVPLLTLGCYQVGRLAFNPLAGLLAVVFALGSPLLISQFHVFMVDAPLSAMVAVSIWLIIASERFTRVSVSALAGLAVGAGMLTKEPFAFSVAGVLIVTLARGSRGQRRGLPAFVAVAAVVALPWYIHEYPAIHRVVSGAVQSHEAISTTISPARLSLANLQWYAWNVIEHQLYLPLAVLALVGWVWMLVGFVREHPRSPIALELVVGAGVAWVAITETFVHDTRYSEPLLVYLAVLGTGWIVSLSPRWRAAGVALVSVVALSNTLGLSLGVGRSITIGLPAALETTSLQGRVAPLYSTVGFLVGPPKRDGDMLAMLRALHRTGIEAVGWDDTQARKPDFSNSGVIALVRIAGLRYAKGATPSTLTRRDAAFSHEPISPREPPPCVRLDDHTGVWVRIGNPRAPGARDYCPLPKPHFYGPAER